MKDGKFFRILFAAGLTFTIAAAEDTTTTPTNNRGKISGIFQQILKSAITNLTQSSAGTNIISSTNTNTPTPTPNSASPLPSASTNATSLASSPQFELSAGLKEAIG